MVIEGDIKNDLDKWETFKVSFENCFIRQLIKDGYETLPGARVPSYISLPNYEKRYKKLSSALDKLRCEHYDTLTATDTLFEIDEIQAQLSLHLKIEYSSKPRKPTRQPDIKGRAAHILLDIIEWAAPDKTKVSLLFDYLKKPDGVLIAKLSKIFAHPEELPIPTTNTESFDEKERLNRLRKRIKAQVKKEKSSPVMRQ